MFISDITNNSIQPKFYCNTNDCSFATIQIIASNLQFPTSIAIDF